MYARLKTFPNKDGTQRTYLQIVESYRVGGKCRQRVVANLGRLEELQEGQLDRLIDSLARYSKSLYLKLNEADANWSKQWGPALILHHLWEKKVNLGPILRHILSQTEKTSPVEEAVFAMVLNRLTYPLSKLGLNERWLNSIYRPEFGQLQLHHFYRALDFLAESKEEIERLLFEQVRNLFNLEVDLVFWDTTSTYFEGNGPKGLAEKGHSKEHRPDRVQILVGVLMTKEGIPVAHQVFPGNTADIDTFKKAIRDTRERFCLKRVIFVGDRGMVSPDLLDQLDHDHIDYIAGVKMRKSTAVNAVLKTGGRYKKVSDHLQVKEVWYDADRYIVCYNPKRAERDKKTREELIVRLTKKLQKGAKSLVGSPGYRRYLVIGKTEASLNQEAIQKEARYDGKYVLRTNCDLDSHEVAEAYKTLWRVERAFRELKSGLDLRPVYHYADSRVKGHVMVCFLALVLESALIRYLNQGESKTSYLKLLADLSQLHAVELTHQGKTYLLRTELAGSAYEAFRVLGIRPPNKVTEVEQPELPQKGKCSGTSSLCL
ncbi:MAG: IS1634 family transposase [Bacillota bacterium]